MNAGTPLRAEAPTSLAGREGPVAGGRLALVPVMVNGPRVPYQVRGKHNGKAVAEFQTAPGSAAEPPRCRRICRIGSACLP